MSDYREGLKGTSLSFCTAQLQQIWLWRKKALQWQWEAVSGTNCYINQMLPTQKPPIRKRLFQCNESFQQQDFPRKSKQADWATVCCPASAPHLSLWAIGWLMGSCPVCHELVSGARHGSRFQISWGVRKGTLIKNIQCSESVANRKC